MRRMWIVSAVAVASISAAALVARPPAVSAEDGPAKPAFIGPDKCKVCHMKQFMSWKKTPMYSAFEKLKPGQAADKKTAAKLDPAVDYTKDAKCLKCHTTGYGTEAGYPALVEGKAWTPAEEERAKLTGLGTCEACHGPGSLYAPYKKEHKDYKRSEIVKLGAITPPKAETCAPCHTKDCPTMGPDYKFDFEAAKKKADSIHEAVPLKENHDG